MNWEQSWQQLKAIFWLRWRLSRNQFVRGGNINAALSVIFGFSLFFSAMALLIGGISGGYFAGAKSSGQLLMFIWDGIILLALFLWFMGVLMEIQRAESIDLTKLLHLPVTLRQVFVFNFIASHFTTFVLLFMPATLGFCAGLIIGGGLKMVLVTPLYLSFAFLVSTWTYCLRGWIAGLMTNKRRRRSIVVWITLVFILMFQLPNLVINNSSVKKNFIKRSEETVTMSQNQKPDFMAKAHTIVPLGWVGYGTKTIMDGNPWPALGWTIVCGLGGVLGLARAYRMTIRFYQGAAKAKTIKTVSTSAKQTEMLFVEKTLPWIPDNVAGLALATLRSLLRAPETKMFLIFPLFMGVFLCFIDISAATKNISKTGMFFSAPIIVSIAAYSLIQATGNMFGHDRNGFRELVLLPTPRHLILAGKNLAYFPFMLGISIFFLVLAAWRLPLSAENILVGILQIPTAFLLISLLTNLFSILVPFRVALGSLKSNKPKPIVILASFLGMMFVPVVISPLFIAPAVSLLFSSQGWIPWLPVGLIVSAGVLAGAVAIYIALIPLEGRLLKRRELYILQEVTEEIE